MALTNSQKALLKCAQRQCALDDKEYRDALQVVSGCRSSTDRAFTNHHLDVALAYFEAIFFRKLDAGELPASCDPNAVFVQRGFWKARNSKKETSRDRYRGSNLNAEIEELEQRLAELGFGRAYCTSIENKVTLGRNDEHSRRIYRSALARTLASKERQANQPF